ncbi:hypothetical protein ABB02_01427 [Clostridiaceae bacterium JG1575]|nr:hypothetical protein ABB02_01427 [Clostridiaceae bacterium JG1575]
MPKTIKDMDARIMKAGAALFGSQGYHNVEMKMIAKECDVAVGTLYNYYQSKWDVFSRVLRLFWRDLLQEMRESSHQENSLEACIRLLDERLKGRQSLAAIFYSVDCLDALQQREVADLRDNVVKDLAELITPHLNPQSVQGFEEPALRVASMLLLMLSHMEEHFDNNSAFLLLSLKNAFIS